MYSFIINVISLVEKNNRNKIAIGKDVGSNNIKVNYGIVLVFFVLIFLILY